MSVDYSFKENDKNKTSNHSNFVFDIKDETLLWLSDYCASTIRFSAIPRLYRTQEQKMSINIHQTHIY